MALVFSSNICLVIGGVFFTAQIIKKPVEPYKDNSIYEGNICIEKFS